MLNLRVDVELGHHGGGNHADGRANVVANRARHRQPGALALTHPHARRAELRRRVTHVAAASEDQKPDLPEEEARILERFGFHSERVDGDTLRAEAPAYTDAVCGAIRFEDSATLSPQAFTAGLARELEARGATIRTDCTVETILTRGDRVEGARLETGEELTAEATVLAAGVCARA